MEFINVCLLGTSVNDAVTVKPVLQSRRSILGSTTSSTTSMAAKATTTATKPPTGLIKRPLRKRSELPPRTSTPLARTYQR